MRRFIYLDTDTINSYLAQIYDGLVKQNEQELQSQSELNIQNKNTVSVNGGADLKVFGKGIEGKLEYTYEHLKETNNSELISDIQTKLLHDNAFDQLMNYLKSENLIFQDSVNIGDFIEITDDFFILDLDYYQKLFESGGFIENLKKIQENNIKNEVKTQLEEGLNREQLRDKNIAKRIIDESNQLIQKNNEEYQSVETIINMIMSVVPYRQMLYMKNYLVALNERFMRDDMNLAAFKYGGKIKLVGYITNKIYDEENLGSPISVFSGISNSMNQMMKVFFDNQKNIFIVHPIAIYYE